MTQARYNPRRNIKRRRPTRITIPADAGPHVKLVFAEMRRQNVKYDEVEEGSGVLRSSLKAWRHKNAPGLTTLEAVLGFLGWDLLPIPRAEVLPPALIEDLKPLAARHGAALETSIAAFMGVAARERGTVGEALPFVGRLRPYPAPKTSLPDEELGEGTDRFVSASTAYAHSPSDGLACVA